MQPEISPDTAAEPPVWPPQTREAAPFASEDAQIDEIVAPAEAGTDEPAMVQLPDAEAGREPEPLPTFALLPEPEPEFEPEPDPQPAPKGSAEPEPEAVPPPAPAASEEGVVGAYQVGTAHFTIYADGSIQARTPEGDYSFASMDELKTYLASEKNRLGA
jgi:hypothetical protein